jgi:glutamate carboxypeptidase
MHPYDLYLKALSEQASAMRDRVLEWVDIPSGSYDIAGLDRMAAKLKDAFAGLGGDCEEIALAPQTAIDARGEKTLLPLGNALRFRKRPDAPIRVFLGIHYDVVYGEAERARPLARMEGDVLRASGACDAKGGIAILLHALEAFEASPWADRLGWEILLNPDEEIGSPGSLPLLKEAAARNHFGLLYEPCLADGNLVGARKGSGNFAAVMRGRASHAGRDPHLGRNAVHALAEFIVALDHLGRRYGGLTVNVARIEGGGALNRVPDLAIARFNLRVRDGEDQRVVEEFLRAQAEEFTRREGYALSIHGNFTSPPKPLEARGLALLEAVAGCGRELGMDLKWQPSGGVSDGNKLAAAGLPNVDTLGARGGDIHSPDEWLDLNSLAERARLTALLLLKVGSGEWAWPVS